MAVGEVSGYVDEGRETALGPYYVLVERTKRHTRYHVRISPQPLGKVRVQARHYHKRLQSK